MLDIPHNDRRLVISYSPVRAEKDRHDRDKALHKLRKTLAKSNHPKALLGHRGSKQYLQIEGESALTLNQDKITEAQRWDGLHGVILSAISETVRQLYKVMGLSHATTPCELN